MKSVFKLFFILGLYGTTLVCEGQSMQKLDESIENVEIPIQNSLVSEGEQSTPGFLNRHKAYADFRVAARNATPAVVHINSIWKISQEESDIKDIEPLREFFGEDFWNYFIEPYRHKGFTQAVASGVIISRGGYIITNNHVIEGADEVGVTLNDRRSYKANLVGADKETDLALLKIDESNLSPIHFANSDEVEVGQWVLAVGNPFNLSSTVTAGIVSAKARKINVLKDIEAVESFIQTDAAVNFGNSGGALVDINGELIGINTAIATPSGIYAGYSFAIPSNIVKKVAGDLLKFGTVKRGYLGITIRDMTGNLANELSMVFRPGVLVEGVFKEGAAYEAGIRPGDIITEIDNFRLEAAPQLQGIIAKSCPGDKLRITYVRNNKEKSVTVELKGKDELAVSKKKP